MQNVPLLGSFAPHPGGGDPHPVCPGLRADRDDLATPPKSLPRGQRGPSVSGCLAQGKLLGPQELFPSLPPPTLSRVHDLCPCRPQLSPISPENPTGPGGRGWLTGREGTAGLQRAKGQAAAVPLLRPQPRALSDGWGRCGVVCKLARLILSRGSFFQKILLSLSLYLS